MYLSQFSIIMSLRINYISYEKAIYRIEITIIKKYWKIEYADSRKVIHDIKNHFAIIEELYKECSGT